MSISKIALNLVLLNLFVSISAYALYNANLLSESYANQIPSLQALENLVNKPKPSSSDINPTMLFGDFIYAVQFLSGLLSGGDLGAIISISMGAEWIKYFIMGMYWLSFAILIVQVVSNRLHNI
ncbi:MAG: hypothetical protein QXK74_07230 [Candidatus Nitrosocaldaceae archaeon]